MRWKGSRAAMAATVLALAVAAACGWAGAQIATCPIPLYRYALEWWEREPYEVYVFCDGALTDYERAVIERLEAMAAGDGGGERAVNLRMRRVESESRERLDSHAAVRGEVPESLPWMVVHYRPVGANARTPVWSGALTDENVDALVDSPKRQEIADLLLNGAAVVWVFLESGNEAADDEAFQILERELTRLEAALEPPDAGAFGVEEIPLPDLRFEALRLSREASEESMLVNMLSRTEPDLERYANEPIVFPIFGRGFVMNALVGGGVNPGMIRETAEVLAARSTCTMTQTGNPGAGLLTAMNWADHIEPLAEEWAPGGGAAD